MRVGCGGPQVNAAERKRVQAIQAYLVSHKAQIGYDQVRPMVTRTIATMAELTKLTAKGFSMDCSESITLICHVAGAQDPTGNSYNGYGNTETMLAHLRNYTNPRFALPGALVVFNSDRPLAEQHVAQVHTSSLLRGDPVLFTHGDAAGPVFARLSQVQPGFQGRTTILSVASL